jgi:hypothetical protein
MMDLVSEETLETLVMAAVLSVGMMVVLDKIGGADGNETRPTGRAQCEDDIAEIR